MLQSRTLTFLGMQQSKGVRMRVVVEKTADSMPANSQCRRRNGGSKMNEHNITTPVRHRCVVRLRRSQWWDSRGIYHTVSLRYIKSESYGFNILHDTLQEEGADSVMPRILNLNDCKDGLYQAILCNERRDFYTGMIEEYDFTLIPYQPTKQKTKA